MEKEFTRVFIDILYSYPSILKTIEETKKQIEKGKEELKKSEGGKLIYEKIQLENTVKNLTQEVESLSIKNENLLKDIKSNPFYDKYHKTIKLLEEAKEENESLLQGHTFSEETTKIHPRLNTSMSVGNNKYNEFIGNVPFNSSKAGKTVSLGRETVGK